MIVRNTLCSLLAAALLSLGLAACQKGPAERAGERVDRAADKAGDSIERATDRARDR